VRSLSKFVGVVAALGIIGLAVWAFVKGVEKDPAVVGTVFTAVAGVAIVVWQRNREKAQELETAHRAQMSPIYQQLIEALKDFEAFARKAESEQKAFFMDLATKLILHGPTPVINAWNAWSRAATPVTPATFIAWENVLIRQDLGHDNSVLPRGDLLRLWVTEDDDDESRAMWRAIKAGYKHTTGAGCPASVALLRQRLATSCA
jgi:hypothetical protein